MLKKFLHIENIGKFKKYDAQGDVQFRELNFIFGENGRGKTTLAAILRSLATNDPNYILERRTIDSKTPIKITVLSEHGRANFDEERNWDQNIPNIEVFDSTFVNENVFSGNVVEHDHKKNLYYFVVGSEGVNLAEEIERLDTESRLNNDEIRKKIIEIEEKIAWKGTIDTFVGLTDPNNLDERIKASENQVNTLEEAKQIQNRSLLSNMELEQFPDDDIKRLLEKKLEDIAQDTERMIREHISSCMDNHGETWIQNGLNYTQEDNKCPFCGQSLEGIALIKVYKNYFSESYSGLKTEIKEMRRQIGEHFSQEILLVIQKIFWDNSALVDNWLEHIQLENSEFEFENFVKSWNTTHALLISLVKRKDSRPLDDIFKEEEIQDALNNISGIADCISTYNIWVSATNNNIKGFKESVRTGDLEKAKEQLDILKATKVRYSEDIAPLCQKYLSLLVKRTQLQNDKAKTRKALDEFTETVFGDCLSSINTYLVRFGAGFCLDKITTSYAGGMPSTSYGLQLDDVSVKLGSANTIGEPSFKSVLSDGDKNSLAFAFFLARLENDPTISEKIVVFDDPITSLDLNRRHCTLQEILMISNKAKQVIVLSNEPFFLRMIWENAHNAKTLHIPRRGQQSAIEEWDIATATQSDYFRNYLDLDEYLEHGEGEPRKVAKCIRLVLEGNLRVRFPKEFTANEWLRAFIDKIRDAKPGDPLEILQDNVDEIAAINDYSKKYHHQQNPDADTEPINETELGTYVERTLRVISS